jgi:hypothetical protein
MVTIPGFLTPRPHVGPVVAHCVPKVLRMVKIPGFTAEAYFFYLNMKTSLKIKINLIWHYDGLQIYPMKSKNLVRPSR